ncbi:SMI1/KNR4 family protein [Luteimonas sp. SJ-92]|uniref:SMI1/KNR4 family protein n=1 Tax=Luteimonas salinisoli TaxID=2752307 RepID=A0A853J9P3_9GAMM|nr:SMI1/KNR4 family protein [Luteimonas salinisoli]NZA25891.1 SMI1/KNR4 family protein [Luteimonas salinisoli]
MFRPSIESWLQQNWPAGLADLSRPASEDEIRTLEQALARSLPEDFVSSLRIHNGQKGIAGYLCPSGELLSSGEIASQWQVWKDLFDSGDFDEYESEPANEAIARDWWNPGWVPITHNGGGDHDCLDLSPTSAGQTGQVITMWHDMAERELLAPNFSTWLQQLAGKLLSCEVVYSEEYGGLIEPENT